MLQAAGIDAGVVQNFEDLNARSAAGAPPALPRGRRIAVIGTHLCETNGMRFSQTPGEIRMPAPCLGEHSEFVYRELLGMSADEYARWAAEGLFE